MPEQLPMFPLGLVAFPGSVVPLRLFEPRYLEMFQDLVDGNGEFGIVLIERGVAESGGGTHFGTGCVVKMMGSTPYEDGTIVLVAVGVERLRVVEWLPDDPYPKALVERLPHATPDLDTIESVDSARASFRRLLALAAEMGAEVEEIDPDLSDNPVAALYEMARMAPLQEIDQQRILEQDSATSAAVVLREEIEGVTELLELGLD